MTSLGEDDFLNDLLKEVEVQKELNWTHKSFIKPLKDLREDKGVVLQVLSLQFHEHLATEQKLRFRGLWNCPCGHCGHFVLCCAVPKCT